MDPLQRLRQSTIPWRSTPTPKHNHHHHPKVPHHHHRNFSHPLLDSNYWSHAQGIDPWERNQATGVPSLSSNSVDSLKVVSNVTQCLESCFSSISSLTYNLTSPKLTVLEAILKLSLTLHSWVHELQDNGFDFKQGYFVQLPKPDRGHARSTRWLGGGNGGGSERGVDGGQEPFSMIHMLFLMPGHRG